MNMLKMAIISSIQAIRVISVKFLLVISMPYKSGQEY